MKPTSQAIERAARKICRSGKFETGQGTCAVLCMDQLGDVRKKGCGHCVRVHARLARDVLSGDLGDMVLVPREALQYIAANSGERTIRDMARAMLAAAAEDSAAGLKIVEK